MGSRPVKLIDPIKGITTSRTPISLGLAFLVVAVGLYGLAIFTAPDDPPLDYISFSENISWPLSIVLLFPVVIALTQSFYQQIPLVFSRLAASQKDSTEFHSFWNHRRRLFNHPVIRAVILAIVAALNYAYYSTLFQSGKHTWINYDGVLSGFTYAGLYSVVVQVFLCYWVALSVWNNLVLARVLHIFFNLTKSQQVTDPHAQTETFDESTEYLFEIDIQPLHPDGCCGLKPITDLCLKYNIILLLLGIYISLKYIDRIFIQEGFLLDDIGNPIFIIAYIFLAPLMFFLPLSSAHKRMSIAKVLHLKSIAKTLTSWTKNSTRITGEKMDNMSKLSDFYEKQKSRIPVWPFDFKSMQSFVVTVLIPIFPTLLSFLAHLLNSFGFNSL